MHDAKVKIVTQVLEHCPHPVHTAHNVPQRVQQTSILCSADHLEQNTECPFRHIPEHDSCREM
jgi:hypothetical protein